MAVKVLLFAQLAELIGTNELSIDNNAATTTELISELERRFPALKGTCYMVAVENDIVSAETKITSDSTVALLPPYSGG
jgi:molybdopterin synthase sulfur carrier subunit